MDLKSDDARGRNVVVLFFIANRLVPVEQDSNLVLLGPDGQFVPVVFF